ncbi:MAG: dihydroorotate dehydrogenase electron transfer subunit [Dehalococcoidia bacterium]|nr:MAG: dihydroorotate dehydrogenase electron transfer subunit [Dehalococcoidia bacterium]
MEQVLASIIYNSEVVPGVYLIWLESAQIASQAKPGQFAMVRCGKGAEYPLRRPLSIHRLDNNKLAFLFTIIGKGTHWLAQRQAGTNIDLLGPLGNGYTVQPGSRKLLLLAGGIGIAPLCFLAEKAINQGCSVTLLLGASTATQLYPRHLLPAQAELVITTEDGTAGREGMITDFVHDFVGQADQIFACGPASMYQTMAAQKQQLKGKPVQISLEMRMGCGLGVCYGCTVKTKNGLKQVCKDGPVFNLDDILWDEFAQV